MKLRQLSAINQVSAAQWDSLLESDYPFLRHAYLHALESSGSVTERQGWTPAHLLVEDAQGRLLAALPLYRKMHSYGEYVFDFQWAEAWERSGRDYYPKYLSAVPFTPVQGPRLLWRTEAGRELILDWLGQRLEMVEVSSLHLLFGPEDLDPLMVRAGWESRLGCQFHWFNEGYGHFEDFLAACTSRKRKNFRKERQAVAALGIEFNWLVGDQLTDQVWEAFYPFYAATYLKRGQQPYLTPTFFQQVGQGMRESVRLLFARQGQRNVAAALFFADSCTLYGRYWGCLEEFDRLHFETCFYQGMDRCIAEGLHRFDAGAQGEHKLIRGFRPVLTHSWHKLQAPLHAAVRDFLERERESVKHFHADAMNYLPYRQAE